MVGEPTKGRISLVRNKVIASLLKQFAMEDSTTSPTPGRGAAREKWMPTRKWTAERTGST